MRKKSLASKAHKIADSALDAFGRVVADLHLAADLLDGEANAAFERADDHYVAGRNAEAEGASHEDAAGAHRARADRIAALIG